jgi:hypothetical protein
LGRGGFGWHGGHYARACVVCGLRNGLGGSGRSGGNAGLFIRV